MLFFVAAAPTSTPTLKPTTVDEKCVCCVHELDGSGLCSSTACYCCCSSALSFDDCVDRCEKDNSDFVCDYEDDWISKSLKRNLDECDAAARAAARLPIFFVVIGMRWLI